MKRHVLLVLICFWLANLGFAQSNPTFNSGEDPKPSGKQWQLVGNLSDEFSGSSLDLVKWRNTDPSRWIGRAPGIFKQNTVSVANGNMRITNYKLATPEWHNGSQFTHAGGHVISENRGQVGYYYEARMKANKTFMSSTFWLINYRNEGTGCDQRVTELDIQECVGYINSSQSWTQDFDQSMHSNTHSRNVTCSEPTGSRGNDTPTSGKVWAGYHVYGAWWKSPTEIQFFLDGNYVYSVTPYADFDLPMYIKLVTETYDWNPVPADGGMTGTWTERTTFYDWVRTWELVNAPNCTDQISFNPPTSVPSQTSYTISVDYTACQSRDVVVEFWDTNWIASATKTVSQGSGSTSLTINLPAAPTPGSNYIWKTSIRPVGTNWQSNLDNDQQNGVTVTAGQLIADGRYAIKSKANNYYLGAPNWSHVGNNYNAITVTPGPYNDQRWDFTHLGNDVYQIKMACCGRYLEVPYANCTNGSNVGTWTSASASHQKWKLEQVGSYYMFKPTHCLTQAMDREPNSGTSQSQGNDNVHTWSANSSNNNQLWEIIPNANARMAATGISFIRIAQ